MWEKMIQSPAFKRNMNDLVQYTKNTILGTRKDFDGELPFNDLTVGMNLEGEYGWQSGDNSYTGGAYHYPVWAVVTIHRREKSAQIVRDIIQQLGDGLFSLSETRN